VLVAAYLSAIYAVAFVIYLAKLHDLLRGVTQRPRALHSFVLIGAVLQIALHAVSTSEATVCSKRSSRRTPRTTTTASRTRCTCLRSRSTASATPSGASS